MKTTQYLLATLREEPSDAELISHKLMLRAGLIRKQASGLYTWLPSGLKVLRKVEKVVREEMDAIGANEILMPMVQSSDLWKESGRWKEFGSELLRFKDRHQRDFCLGPTHEEVITDLVRNEIRSYKQCPAVYYQIQTKFRDEVRPRFGIMRAREFLMKDAYSFHTTKDSLEETYQKMYEAYSKIFTRLKLDFRAVIADTGAIGGSTSHEFHVLAESGEDAIAFSTESNYAANIEKAKAKAPSNSTRAPLQAPSKVATPRCQSIADVCQQLSVDASAVVKTLLIKGATKEHPVLAVCLRGEHTLNTSKIEKHPLAFTPLTMANESEITATASCDAGFVGPVGLKVPIIADRDAAVMTNFVCGANENNQHLTGVNWERDALYDEVFDCRNVVEGDISPDGQGRLTIKRGIEVGHIFQLGTKYSESMKANVLGEDGKAVSLDMGCYGIGVSRIVAAAIEQHHDEYGIIWPDDIAPFQVAIIPMNMKNAYRVGKYANRLYRQLQQAGVDVLLDDRNERPGVMFSDTELIGIPHRIVISERGVDAGVAEYKHRRSNEKTDVALKTVFEFLTEKIGPNV